MPFITTSPMSEAAPPTEIGCMRVTEIAAKSPGEEGGLKAGDLIVAVNGVEAIKVLAGEYGPPLELGGHVYLCARVTGSRAESWTITAPTGFPLGVKVEPTKAGIVAMLGSSRVRDARQLYTDLPDGIRPGDLMYQLWQEGDWEQLLYFSSQATAIAPCGRIPPYTLAARKCRGCCAHGSAWVPCLYLPDPLGRHAVACCCDNGEIGSSALVLQGAAMMELGYQRAGRRLVQWYHEHYEQNETRNFMGVARLYIARSLVHGPSKRGSGSGSGSLLDDAERELVATILDDAASCFGADAAALQRLQLVRGAGFGGAAAPLAPVPLAMSRADDGAPPLPRVRMPRFEGVDLLSAPVGGGAGQVASLGDVTSSMRESALELVVLLGIYRANGPYYGLLREACMLMRVLGPRGTGVLSGCTVLTTFDPERSKSRYWTRMEAAMQEEGHPIRVLHQPDHDEYGAFEAEIEQQLGLQISASPVSGLMDADGVCFWLDAATGGDAPAAELSMAVWQLAARMQQEATVVAAAASPA